MSLAEPNVEVLDEFRTSSRFLNTFSDEIASLIDWEERDVDDWGSESEEYMLASAEAALIQLRAAVKGHDKALVREHATDLGLAALKISAILGGL